MPFLTTCSFCPNKLSVPDQAAGASLRCPKCGNYFTVAPSAPAPVSKPRRPPAPAKVAPAPMQTPPPTGDQAWWVSSTPDAAIAPAPAPAPVSPEPSAPAPAVRSRAPVFDFPEPPPPSSSSLPAWINIWGVFAFSLAAVALLLAASALPRWLSLSFAGLGLLLGLIGLAVPREEWKIKDGIWLALGGGICGLLLLVGLARPAWMNDRWGRDFEVYEPDSNKQFMVSRNNDSEVKELSGGERVDASTHAIRQGDILLRIESAVVERLQEKDAPVLLVALHLENVGHLHIVAYKGQGSGEQVAVVRDSRGKELPRRDLGPELKKLGQIGAVTVLPTHEVKDLLAVEAPWTGTAHIEVDLPSAAWGREGVCKFTIPAKFVLRK